MNRQIKTFLGGAIVIIGLAIIAALFLPSWTYLVVICIHIAFLIVTSKVCPECGKIGVSHSHTVLLGSTYIEVHECRYCKSQSNSKPRK